MTELEKTILGADDEYLAAISNKGILKRGYADLEKTEPRITARAEDKITVEIGEAQCVLKLPLTDCGCSCPSSSICRHIMTAILFVKRELSKDSSDTAAQEQDNAAPAVTPADIIELLKTQSIAELKKAAGNSRIKKIAAEYRGGVQSDITYASFITVRLASDNVSVRLVGTPEASVCSCRSQALCPHKAEAALRVMLREGIISPDELDPPKSLENTVTPEMLDAADSVRGAIAQWFAVGLCRLDSTAAEQAERLAVVCHNAKMPGFEKRCRAAADMLSSYAGSSAVLRPESIMRSLMSLYRDASRLGSMPPEYAAGIIGEFREQYLPLRPVELTLVSERAFSGRSGYDGTIYYFYGLREKRWYTLTNARPTFYDNKRRRESEYIQVWDLSLPIDKLYGKRFVLGSGMACGMRLSATGKAVTEFTGSFTPCEKAFEDIIIYDYRTLADMLDGQYKDIPVIISPERITGSGFDNIAQRFETQTRDRNNARLDVSLSFSDEDEHIIRALEKLCASVEATKRRPPLLFGTLFIRDGRLKLYPIDIIEREDAIQ